MRLLYTLFSLAIGGYGLFWVAEKHPDIKQKIEEILDFRSINALEVRFDSAQIMEKNQKQLLKEKGARFLDSELKFVPFILMKVKYCDRKNKTKESMILWDLNDGEMILDTKTWEKTHGFADCILNHAHEQEYKVLKALSDFGGSCDTRSLLSKLGIEMHLLEMVLRSCLKKNLIISCGEDKYRLHLEKPNMVAIPETIFHEQLTTRARKKANRTPNQFSKGQVQKIAKISFGETFSIRTITEIYLPIHRIQVQNPDGSIQTFHFNALNGKELPPATFYE